MTDLVLLIVGVRIVVPWGSVSGLKGCERIKLVDGAVKDIT